MAAPFVQRQLRAEKLSVEITTQCAHCNQPLHITVDSEMNWSVQEQEAQPLVFEPEIDWQHFTESTIIEDY
jgi:uncharacterized metal-binding protein YceD (DUF177 family)